MEYFTSDVSIIFKKRESSTVTHAKLMLMITQALLISSSIRENSDFTNQ